jgi:ParB-like chromosome segregation protein Spo0J
MTPSTPLEFHEVANIFPMMSADEYAALVNDIRANGQREPIWTHEGKIIDGRNRYRACQELRLTPLLREWDGNGSLVAFVVSLNLHRRHLDSSQRAVIGLEVEKALAVEAKARQGARNDISQRFDESRVGRADAQAAALVGSNRQYISDAKRIARDAPDVLESVRNGKVAIPDAKRIATLPEVARAALLTRVENGDIKSKDIQDEVRAVRRTLPPTLRQAPILPLPDTVRLEVADASSLPLADESVDLIVTSPPYGVGKDYARYTDPSEAWYEFMQQWLN